MNETTKWFVQWVVATATAAVVGLGYLQDFVYPRTEGEKLEKHVMVNRKAIDKNRDRYEKILEILLDLQGRKP